MNRHHPPPSSQSETIDKFLLQYEPTELQIASEFFTEWFTFLSQDFCNGCRETLRKRICSLDPGDNSNAESSQSGEYFNTSSRKQSNGHGECQNNHYSSDFDANSRGSRKGNGKGWSDVSTHRSVSRNGWSEDGPDVSTYKAISEPARFDSPVIASGWSEDEPDVSAYKVASEPARSDTYVSGNGLSEDVPDVSAYRGASEPTAIHTPVRMSWADMAQEDELYEEEDEEEEEERGACKQVADGVHYPDEGKVEKKLTLSREQREYIRFKNVQRKKDFICLQRLKGNLVNIIDGLELHKGVFSAAEQKRIVNFIYDLQERGRKGELKPRTYTAPAKWMRGKGRVTIQFGCCYNYAVDKAGNPPGILRKEMVDPIPPLFKVIIRRLVGWHVLPPWCVPDSCIVNIYDEGDCIPPHIDNHDFVRPFCTISFLSECNILFGLPLEITGPGEFSGATAIPLPVGSVLVLNGNGADVAKHCVPAVPTKRISITFRKMDEGKCPIGHVREPDLQGLQPLPYDDDDESKTAGVTKSAPLPNRQPIRDGSVDESRNEARPDRQPYMRVESENRGRGFENRGGGRFENRGGFLGRGILGSGGGSRSAPPHQGGRQFVRGRGFGWSQPRPRVRVNLDN